MLLVHVIVNTARPWANDDTGEYQLRFGWPMKLLALVTITVVIRLAVIFVQTRSELPVWVLCVSIPVGLLGVLVSLELIIARIEVRGDFLYQTTVLGLYRRVPLDDFVSVEYSEFFHHWILRSRMHGKLLVPKYMSGSSSLVTHVSELMYD